MSMWNKHSSQALCAKCVKDPVLRDHIVSEGQRRRCALCASTIHSTLKFGQLGHIFREVVDQIYVETDPYEGDQVGYLLQDQFELFHDDVDPERMMEVVEQILKSGLVRLKDALDMPDYEGTFRPVDREWEVDLLDRVTQWSGPGTGVANAGGSHLDPFWPAFEDMSETLLKGDVLYRARLHDIRGRKTRWEPADLRAPPASSARAGRANRQGVPVLYTASDWITAVQELRPWIGCAVAVAEVQLARDVLIVDATPRQVVESPFFQELLDWKVNLPALIYAFAEELSRPVGPEEVHRYEPTQRMCEIVASGGYGGIRYPSALGPGSNIVFFDPAAGTPLHVGYVRAQSIQMEHEELGDDEDPYEDSPFEDLFMDVDKGG